MQIRWVINWNIDLFIVVLTIKENNLTLFVLFFFFFVLFFMFYFWINFKYIDWINYDMAMTGHACMRLRKRMSLNCCNYLIEETKKKKHYQSQLMVSFFLVLSFCFCIFFLEVFFFGGFFLELHSFKHLFKHSVANWFWFGFLVKLVFGL